MSETSPDPVPCLVAMGSRALIAVSGEDAAHFLHSVLTANIEALPAGEARLAALLTPQGKIIADMLVANASDEESLFFLDVNRGFAEDVVRRLMVYRLRAKVEIAMLGDSVRVFVALDAPRLSHEAFYAFPDPRAGALGQRLYGPAQEIFNACQSFHTAVEPWHAKRRISLGIPECGPDYPPLASYPHEANLDQLGGVDFRKGCYIGQEIVSRMEHRGTARTRTLLAHFQNGFGVDSGAELRAGDQLLGTLGMSAGAMALAQVRLDRWQDAQEKNTGIFGGGVPVLLEKPGYARF